MNISVFFVLAALTGCGLLEGYSKSSDIKTKNADSILSSLECTNKLSQICVYDEVGNDYKFVDARYSSTCELISPKNGLDDAYCSQPLICPSGAPTICIIENGTYKISAAGIDKKCNFIYPENMVEQKFCGL